MDCQCDICKSACEKRPGWFMPGEVAKAAELLEMSEQDFFQQYVAVDYWITGEDGGVPGAIFTLSPIVTSARGGEEYPFDPHGSCVFYRDGKCAIHAVKPHGCAWYDHTKSEEEGTVNQHKIRDAWKGHQDDIVRLLGREPEVPQPSIGEIMTFMFGMLTPVLPEEMRGAARHMLNDTRRRIRGHDEDEVAGPSDRR